MPNMLTCVLFKIVKTCAQINFLTGFWLLFGVLATAHGSSVFFHTLCCWFKVSIVVELSVRIKVAAMTKKGVHYIHDVNSRSVYEVSNFLPAGLPHLQLKDDNFVLILYIFCTEHQLFCFPT